jgi:glycosyltransferase involved in cell wall biosynthesis
VYNGENYLPEAIDALLSQTFLDFRLVISDNASTDATAQICQAAAASDQRVVYHRQEHNLGAAPNYNAVFDGVASELFMWATHDDLKYPTYVERCVERLDQDPAIPLAYGRYEEIDGEGRKGAVADARPELGSPDPAVRLERVITRGSGRWPRNNTYPIFGVIRSSVIRTTAMHGSYQGSDRVFLAEIALAGPFAEIDDVLMGYRFHAAQSMAAATGAGSDRASWFDTSRAGKPGWPGWRRQREFLNAIERSPLAAADRRRCKAVVARSVLGGEWRYLAADVAGALGRVRSRAARS